MATISNVELTISVIGSSGAPTNRADLNCYVSFAPNEVQANQWYYIQAYLWEEDERRDTFTMTPDGRMDRKQLTGDDPDDPVGLIQDKEVRPNGQSQVPVKLSRTWSFSDLDDVPPVMEKFFATVAVVPKYIKGDWKFSPTVNVDVG